VAPFVAALAIGGGGALLFGGVTAFAHDVSSVAGTVNCAGDYSITVTGDVYDPVLLVVTLGSGTTGNVFDGKTGQTATVSPDATYPSTGSFTGAGATVGEAITAYPNDGGARASGTLAGPVGGCSATTKTNVIDSTTGHAWGSTETTGASAYDTATVTISDSSTPSGTVTYSFFRNDTCAGTPSATDMVTLNADGTVPSSSTEGPLAAGSYAFQATSSVASNYAGSTSGCEPFTVGRGTSTTATAVKDAATGLAWSGSEATGASAYDTATVATSDGFTATGTVAYTFFTNGACSTGTGATDTVTLTAAGLVPNSKTEGPLAAGSYAFQAAYSGDSNYAGSTSACEPFSVPTGGVQGLTSTPTGAVLGITTPDTGGAGPSAGGWGWLSLALALLGGALLVGQWAIRPARIKIQDI
jgi:hypothetical protein